MKHHWISVYRPKGYRPASMENPSMIEAINALNVEMVAAEVRVFVGATRMSMPCGRPLTNIANPANR